MKKTIYALLAIMALYSPVKAQELIPHFLKIPFQEGTDFRVTEGWNYSKEEKNIHNLHFHQAIDFSVPRNTPVYAADDGYAIASSQISYLDKNYQNKKIGYAYGNFVQIWHPEQKIFTLYAHLEKISDDIPYLPPIKYKDAWIPVGIQNQLSSSIFQKSIFIRQGDLIGYAGDSGLSWGYKEFPQLRPNPIEFPSWDEVHLHFEVLKRNKDGLKLENFDPYGIYGEVSGYEENLNPEKSLWILDDNNSALYAKE